MEFSPYEINLAQSSKQSPYPTCRSHTKLSSMRIYCNRDGSSSLRSPLSTCLQQIYKIPAPKVYPRHWTHPMLIDKHGWMPTKKNFRASVIWMFMTRSVRINSIKYDTNAVVRYLPCVSLQLNIRTGIRIELSAGSLCWATNNNNRTLNRINLPRSSHRTNFVAFFPSQSHVAGNYAEVT